MSNKFTLAAEKYVHLWLNYVVQRLFLSKKAFPNIGTLLLRMERLPTEPKAF